VDNDDTKLMPLPPPGPMLGAICQLQKAMLEMPQADLETKHHFGPGVYARELIVPAGSLIIGKTHSKEHLIIVANGDMTIVTEHGRQRVCGPAVFTSPAGVKRAGYAHEDTTVITIHPTNETDVDKIEAEVIIPDRHDALTDESMVLKLLQEITE